MSTHKSRLLSFSDFSRGVFESSSYEIPGIVDLHDGGYEIHIAPLDSSHEERFDKIFISKQNDKSIGLSFLDKNGREAEIFWIPKEATESTENSIRIKSINRWASNPDNKSKLEDFFEDFADSVENYKLTGSSRNEQNAKDDVEMIIDLFEIPSRISSFKKSGENQWDAELENGKIVEITKRNSDDLVSTFKVYPDINSSTPSLIIQNTSTPKTTFNSEEIGKIEIDDVFLGLKKCNPYIKFLFKKSLGIVTHSDDAELYAYFRDNSKKSDMDLRDLRNIATLLKDTVDQSEIRHILDKR